MEEEDKLEDNNINDRLDYKLNLLKKRKDDSNNNKSNREALSKKGIRDQIAIDTFNILISVLKNK